jgi:hypothetical protein
MIVALGKDRMTRSIVGRWHGITVCAALALAACGGGGHQDPPKVPLAQRTTDRPNAVEAAHAVIGPAAKAALDSGNALFRKKGYAGALAQYRAAAALAPQHSAPLFGIYMVARATNDSAMADSALAGIRLRSGSTTMPPHPLPDSASRKMHDSLRKKSTAD